MPTGTHSNHRTSHMINSNLTLSTRHLSIRIQSGWGDITAQEIPSHSFLTQHATQLLVKAMVICRSDYCNALLSGRPCSCTNLCGEAASDGPECNASSGLQQTEAGPRYPTVNWVQTY